MEQKFHSIRQSIPHSSPSGGNSGFRTNAGDCPDRVGVVPRALLAGYLPVAGWLNSSSGHTVLRPKSLILIERVEYIMSEKLEKNTNASCSLHEPIKEQNLLENETELEMERVF